jgi:glycosyltransferase involved in cell wall biosynthesis
VVDDNSDDQQETQNICKEYDFVEYVQLDKHVDAGGCRNIGMQYFQHAKYTMFCDSDDYYMDNDAFLKLYNRIIDCNYPECVSF